MRRFNGGKAGKMRWGSAFIMCLMYAAVFSGEALISSSGSALSQGRKLFQVGANLNANVDVNALANQIGGLLDTGGAAQDCGSFVQNAVNTISSKFPTWYVLVCNLATNCQPALSGGPNTGNTPLYLPNYKYQNIQYGVWVFGGGSLNHCGSDGGWVNWGFTGGDRSGNSGCNVVWQQIKTCPANAGGSFGASCTGCTYNTNSVSCTLTCTCKMAGGTQSTSLDPSTCSNAMAVSNKNGKLSC